MKIALRVFSVLILAILLAVAAGYAWLRQSLPQLEGSLTLSGLKAPVEIVRDRHGVPHIYAGSAADAYFALGFVHAQDRLWQMEMNRRTGSGRLSEALGAATLDADKFLRTLGIRSVAEATLKSLSDETRSQLDAYAAGVNAFLAQRSGPLPPEFLLTGIQPEPWQSADSVAWAKMMAWDLGANWRMELLRLRLAKKLSSAQIGKFLPPYPGDAPLAVADYAALYRQLDASKLAALALPGLTEDGASNNWVLAGSRTASGKPLLANDPHLGLAAPAIWYFAHLSAPGFEVMGATLPGVPAVVLGRSRQITWGMTNTGPDVQDLYIERVDAAGQVLSPQGWQKLATHGEVIKVKGQPDVALTVRASRHGPLISDVFKPAAAALPQNFALAFAWTTLREDDLSIQALGRFATAGNWNEFLAAARDFHSAQQNIVYADAEGNIGFIAPGRVPVRKPENDLKGQAPAPGWDAKYDWDGFIAFDELPQSYNPAAGAIVTANQKIVPDSYRHYLTSEWVLPYRAERIKQLLEATPKHTLHSFAKIQADTVSLQVREILPLLLKSGTTGADAQQVLQQLGQWNGNMASESAEPLIVSAWLRELGRLIYADELGELFNTEWTHRADFMYQVLANTGGQGHWCDDVNTPAKESCADLLPRALDLALADLKRRYGDDRKQWRWGEAHFALSEHRPFGRQAQLAKFFDIRVPSPGDTYTVDVGRNTLANESAPFANRHAASLRAIYDLADLDRSVYIHSTGQSGNLLSPLYRNFAERWARVEYIPMSMKRSDALAGSLGTLKLQPR
ncbi:MAG: penicillin acylase family protein [Betaproteobacteria bacterium]|nr:penicillin acylase family protein [Betaproteobacteria bacterium]